MVLLRFEAANHRSIAEPVEVTFIAVDNDRLSTRRFDLLSEQVLTVAGIYGPNASGKSNVLDALAWLSAAVGQSLRSWDDRVPRAPFRFGGWPDRVSTYEVEAVVRGIRHLYRVEVDDEAVAFEGLYSFPLRKRRTLFEREGTSLQFRRGLGGAAGTRELLTPTTLALSAAMRLGEPEMEPFGRMLAGIQFMGPSAGGWQRLGSSRASTARLFRERAAHPELPLFGGDEPARIATRATALALLRFADLGIDDVAWVDDPTDAGGRPKLQFVHRAGSTFAGFDPSEESEGTRIWFRLIGPTLDALETGRMLVVDELDGSLHPGLSARLLEIFQDPETNPRNAQLLFTSHDTSLLNHLNRDEVWLTEKSADHATTLTALTDFGGEKVRRSMNLERAYLQGRFGAIPELDQFVLRYALGLHRPTD